MATWPSQFRNWLQAMSVRLQRLELARNRLVHPGRAMISSACWSSHEVAVAHEGKDQLPHGCAVDQEVDQQGQAVARTRSGLDLFTRLQPS